MIRKFLVVFGGLLIGIAIAGCSSKVDPTDLEKDVSAALLDYSNSLATGEIISSTHSQSMNDLFLERRSFYNEFFQVALHSALTSISSEFEIRTISESPNQVGQFIVEAAEVIDFEGVYLDESDCLIQAVYWASLQVENAEAKTQLVEYFEQLTNEKNHFIGSSFPLTWIVEHQIIVLFENGKIWLVQDNYTDANSNDNLYGTDTIEWTNGTFSRKKPDLTWWPDFEKYKICIEKQGQELLDEYEKQ